MDEFKLNPEALEVDPKKETEADGEVGHSIGAGLYKLLMGNTHLLRTRPYKTFADRLLKILSNQPS